MRYSGASQLIVGGMAVVLLTAAGCSSMKWFQSGSDEGAVAGAGQPGSEGRSAMKGGQAGSGDLSEGATRGSNGGLAGEEQMHGGTYPSLGRQDGAGEAEGGRLRGISPLVNGQISGEERLSRSGMGGMSLSGDRDEQWRAQVRQEEAAAMEAGLKDVFYGYNQYSVSENDGIASLTTNAGWLKENPTSLLKISGHCDERGSHDYNLVLGEKRAKAAKSFLVDLGVSPKQVAIISYGKDRPFCADHDEVCYQQNRRGHMMLRK